MCLRATRAAAAVMLARLGEFDLLKRNLRSFFANAKEDVCSGPDLPEGGARRASYADGQDQAGTLPMQSAAQAFPRSAPPSGS